MDKFQGSVLINVLVFLAGLAAMVLMCWVLVSGVGWRWELW